VILLAFLGFNVFKYLGNATDTVSDIFKPILSFFGRGVTKTVGTTVNVAGKGTKGIVDATTGTINSGLDVLENRLENREETDKGKSEKHYRKKGPEDDDTNSTTQRRGEGKGGYCYIGQDNGDGVCMKVNNAESCMSGDIFDSAASCRDSK
jgi:hypothetical protein